MIVAIGKAEGNAMAATAMVEPHHQTQLLRRSAPADNIEAEGFPPTKGLASQVFDMLEIRLPDQRAVGKDPDRLAGFLKQNLTGGLIVVFIAEFDQTIFWPGIRFLPVHQCNQFSGQ